MISKHAFHNELRDKKKKNSDKNSDNAFIQITPNRNVFKFFHNEYWICHSKYITKTIFFSVQSDISVARK